MIAMDWSYKKQSQNLKKFIHKSSKLSLHDCNWAMQIVTPSKHVS